MTVDLDVHMAAIRRTIDRSPGISETLLERDLVWDDDVLPPLPHPLRRYLRRLEAFGYRRQYGPAFRSCNGWKSWYWWPPPARCADIARDAEPGSELHERAMHGMLTIR